MGHLDNTSVAEALVRLLGADEQTATFMPPAELAWLPHTNVLQVPHPESLMWICWSYGHIRPVARQLCFKHAVHKQ